MESDNITEIDLQSTEIKQEPEDYSEADINETSSETLTEPSSSNAVCNDESTLPYDTNEAIKEEVLENPSEINYDTLGEFCFESDHLALKSNNDYKNLLEVEYCVQFHYNKNNLSFCLVNQYSNNHINRLQLQVF